MRLSTLVAPILLATLAACTASPAPGGAATGAAAAVPSAAPGSGAGATADAAAGPTAAGPAAAEAGTVSGVVAETMNSGGYTYARLSEGGSDKWIAATEMPLAVGNTVKAVVSMAMEQFHSRTLNRDFPLIYFVGEVAVNGAPLALPASATGVEMAASHASAASPSDGEAAARPGEPLKVTTKIAPAPGGLTVADLWARRTALAGKVVIVRGQVVKSNNEILGKNWFHVQDGSGTASAGTHDLTVTTSEVVTVGDIVTVTGTLLTDRDFGAGYSYALMLENAVVTK